MTVKEDLEKRIQMYREMHTDFGDKLAGAGTAILAKMADELLNKEIEDD